MQKKVLVADNEDDLRALLAATIRGNERYIVFEAKDGIEALKIARKKKPDLILLDILMPGMDGFEVCRQLKAHPDSNGIVVVILTALTEETYKEKARQVGADGYFTKPFSPTALLRNLEEVLGQ